MSLIKCHKCHADILANSKFCSSCGINVNRPYLYCPTCNIDLPEGSSFCSSCGKSLHSLITVPDISFDSHIKPVKNAIFTTVKIAVSPIYGLIGFGKNLFKSQKEKDIESITELTQMSHVNDKVNLNLESFKAAMTSTINAKFAEIMKGKTKPDNFLTYTDGQILTASVRNIFISSIKNVPPQIEVACELSEAILAPTSAERNNLLKSAVGIGGGAAGIGMILTAVGSALGWGTSVVASMSAFFVGTSMAGPAGWAIAGLSLTGIAAYFATTSNKHTDTERFLNVLKQANCKAVDTIWSEYEEPLTKVLDREQ